MLEAIDVLLSGVTTSLESLVTTTLYVDSREAPPLTI